MPLRAQIVDNNFSVSLSALWLDKMGMIRRLVPLAVFNTVVLLIRWELGSIPKRSRKNLKSGFPARSRLTGGQAGIPKRSRKI